jgi:hypothetical protein
MSESFRRCRSAGTLSSLTAIRHGHPGRVEQDVDDVIALVKINHLNVSDQAWREVFLKHEPPELHEKLLGIQGRTATG